MMQYIMLIQNVLNFMLSIVSAFKWIKSRTLRHGWKWFMKRSYLLRLSWCGLLDSPAGCCGGGGDLHDGCGCLRAIGCGTGLRCDRRSRIPHEPHAALDPNVWIPLGSHVEHLQAIIVEAWELALKRSTPVSLPAPNLYSSLAVEDCKLPPCGRTMLHIYKNVEL